MNTLNFSKQIQLSLVLSLVFALFSPLNALKAQQPNSVPVKAGQAFKAQKGRTDYSMHWDGKDRHFIVYIPQKYNPQQATPVVFMFHGTSGNGEKMYDRTKWKEGADKEGFIAIFPSSWRYYITDKGRVQTKWNSNGLPMVTKPGTHLMDDVGFVRAIVGSLRKSLNVDDKRIYASGFSNGGAFISSKVLPELSDIFAAVSAGGGIFHQAIPMQHPAIPLYQIVGSNDSKLIDRLQVPIPTDASQWINDATYGPFISNALKSLQLANTYDHQHTSKHSTLRYDDPLNGGRGKYIFSVISNMGHVYPNGSNNPHGFIAAKRFWAFFKNHPKP